MKVHGDELSVFCCVFVTSGDSNSDSRISEGKLSELISGNTRMKLVIFTDATKEEINGMVKVFVSGKSRIECCIGHQEFFVT